MAKGLMLSDRTTRAVAVIRADLCELHIGAALALSKRAVINR
jgi:hypothetical protein